MMWPLLTVLVPSACVRLSFSRAKMTSPACARVWSLSRTAGPLVSYLAFRLGDRLLSLAAFSLSHCRPVRFLLSVRGSGLLRLYLRRICPGCRGLCLALRVRLRLSRVTRRVSPSLRFLLFRPGDRLQLLARRLSPGWGLSLVLRSLGGGCPVSGRRSRPGRWCMR